MADVPGRIVELGDACSAQTRLRVGSAVWGDIGANAVLASGAKAKENGAYAQYILVMAY